MCWSEVSNQRDSCVLSPMRTFLLRFSARNIFNVALRYYFFFASFSGRPPSRFCSFVIREHLLLDGDLLRCDCFHS